MREHICKIFAPRNTPTPTVQSQCSRILYRASGSQCFAYANEDAAASHLRLPSAKNLLKYLTSKPPTHATNNLY